MGIEIIVIALVLAVVGFFVLSKKNRDNQPEPEPTPKTPETEKAKHRWVCARNDGTWTEVTPDAEYHCTGTSSNTDFKIVSKPTSPYWDKTDL
jgi:hypothetical protein